MRELKYLSPTSVTQFFKEPKEFYLQRLAPVRPPKFQQTKPMAVGSSFDAYVKNYLYEKFIGKSIGTEYDLSMLLATQVDAVHKHDPARPDGGDRQWLYDAGAFCLASYRRSGALASLMQDLSVGYNIKFESTVQRIIQGVPLLGKPDLKMHVGDRVRSYKDMINADWGIYILDWKVNGYCSNSPKSPAKYYLKCMDGWDANQLKHSRSHGKEYSTGSVSKGTLETVDCQMFYGVPYVDSFKGEDVYLEQVDGSWARQLATYSWIMGAKVGGTDLVVAIDQLACGNKTVTNKCDVYDLSLGKVVTKDVTGPDVRIAQLHMRIGQQFQLDMMREYRDCWAIVGPHENREIAIADYFQMIGLNVRDMDEEAMAMAEVSKADGGDFLMEAMGRRV